MRHTFAIICSFTSAAILMMGAWSAAQAQEESSQNLSKSHLVSMSATIQKIDKQHRIITLRDDTGRTTEVAVGPEVRNFDQLKPGDRVDVGYYQSVVASIRKPGQPAPPMGQREETQRAPAGAKPGGTMTRQTKITATIVSVDPQAHTVTLRGPRGNTETVTVEDPELQRSLADLKPGDQADITMTEAVAVSVQPAAKKK